MRRDLARDLEALDRLPAPDLLEEAEGRARGQSRGSDLDLVPSRRWLRAVPLGIAALAVAIGVFVLLNAAFRTAPPTPPAGSNGPSYVFSNVRLDSTGPDGEGNILVRFEVAWSEETYPGIHHCVASAFGAGGQVVSQRVERWIAFEPSDNVAFDVPPPSASATSAEVTCDPERLDTPGIADVVPLDPAMVGRELEAWNAELERRTDTWAQRFSINTMSDEELAANIVALGYASVNRTDASFPGPGSDEWLWARDELLMRAARLCHLLPVGHELQPGCS